MNVKSVQSLAVVFLAIPTALAWSEEIEGSLKLTGNEVEIQLYYKDGRPAAGVQVRVVDASQRTAATSCTDDRGHWTSEVRSPGRYQAFVETGREGEESLSFPFTVAGKTEARPVPWSTLFLGLACLLGAAFLFFAGARKSSGIPILLAAASGFLGWSVWTGWGKPMASAGPAGPDIARDARAFLRGKNVEPLSAPLKKLLEDDGKDRIKSQPHALLGKAAPDFELPDHRETMWKLRDRLKHGPVVLVFYYGYSCNHCVGQLFALHDDVSKFRELDADILAVSADPPELTRTRFKQYGEFAFPVLSDPGNKTALAYGVYQPASGTKAENLQHGTFVIGRDGVIHWANCGDEPFTQNRTLIHELAKLEGRLP